MHIKQTSLLLITLFSFNVMASEYFHLVSDLDGDDKTEVITATITGEGDFKKYSIKINNAKYNGKFYAANGSVPLITKKKINHSKKTLLLFIKTTGPDFIDFKILTYNKGKIIQLLHHMTKNDDEPQISGNILKTESHFGFWVRKNHYTLNDDRTKLILMNTIFPVHVSGKAAKLLSLEQASCKSTKIPKGSSVVVEKYDNKYKKYLIKNKEMNACGWVNEREIIDTVSNLPWSG